MKTETSVCALNMGVLNVAEKKASLEGVTGLSEASTECYPEVHKKGEYDCSSQCTVVSASTDTASVVSVYDGQADHLQKTFQAGRVEPGAAMVVVDPWSTGDRLCAEIVDFGYHVILLWEETNVRSKTLPCSEVVLHKDFETTVATLRDTLAGEYDIVGVLPGSETGVLLAEKVANALHLPTNPPLLAQARRNKFLMGETLKQKGVRSVYQLITRDWIEAKAFIEDFNPTPFRIIVKPNMGAGSDDVHLCKSLEDVKRCFNIVNGKLNSLGLKNDGVLIQEFLEGDEFVIDSVSRNGEHTITSLWKYDKREANDRFNVYFGSFPMVNDSDLSQQLLEYMIQVLDALEFQNGPAHAEIKMTPTGPCLVEIGARCHGGCGTWVNVAQQCWGFDQITALIEANADTRPLETTLPAEQFPTAFKNYGVVLDFVTYEDGVLVEIPGDAVVKGLKSFSSVLYYNKLGDKIVKTVDCNTSPGQVILIHESKAQVEEDYLFVHNLLKQKNGLFKLKST